MEKADFIKLLEQPKQLETYSYESLEQLILKHPYCLSLRMLLLYKYRADQNQSTQKYLELTTIYAPNLQKLKAFLQK